MKVSGIGGGPTEARKTGKAGKSEAGAFARHLNASIETPEEPAVVDAGAAVGGIGALLAVQAAEDSTEREHRRRLVTYGETLLDRLDEIRHGLLMGAIPNARLISLAALVREQREKGANPHLTALLDEIELRVEVELAKLSQQKLV